MINRFGCFFSLTGRNDGMILESMANGFHSVLRDLRMLRMLQQDPWHARQEHWDQWQQQAHTWTSSLLNWCINHQSIYQYININRPGATSSSIIESWSSGSSGIKLMHQSSNHQSMCRAPVNSQFNYSSHSIITIITQSSESLIFPSRCWSLGAWVYFFQVH